MASSEVGTVSRAGTLTYASPEKASSKPYDSKDDMWALGCIMSELVTGVPLTQRCVGGVMAFNKDLIERVVLECETQCSSLGRIVGQLLAVDPKLRPSAEDIVALLNAGRVARAPGASQSAVQELCEEYMCSLCGELVMDAQSACSDEHVFCFLCLDAALLKSNTCPTCKAEVTKTKTQRVVNNMADKAFEPFFFSPPAPAPTPPPSSLPPSPPTSPLLVGVC